MKGRTIIIVVVILAVVIIAVAVLNRQGRLDGIKAQLGIEQEKRRQIEAEQAKQEACKKNWLCATTTLMGGVADVGSSFSLGSLFNKDN